MNQSPIVSTPRVRRWFRLFRSRNRPAYQAAQLAKFFAANRRSQVPST